MDIYIYIYTGKALRYARAGPDHIIGAWPQT